MPYLFIFGFVFIILRDGQKKILLQFMSESVLLMFFSTSFIVFGLTVVSLMHFEINSLSVALFAITFSHSEGCLFT